MHWRWRYLNSEISDLSAYCPCCDTELVAIVEKVLGHLEFASWGSRPRILHMHCETCCQDCYTSDSVSLYDLRGMVERQIDRVIRAGEWRRGIEGATQKGPGEGAAVVTPSQTQ